MRAALAGVACAVWVFVGALVWLVPAPQEVQAAAVFAPTNAREQFAGDLLAALGNTQPTADTVAMVVEWTLAEDSGEGALARNNPLNTTQGSAAETMVINGDGVRGYATYQDGLQATITTITNGYYDAVVVALLANDAEGARQALWASPWAASHYGYGTSWPRVELSTASSGRKHPVTDTMAVSANFYSTGSPYWSGQAGGMHLGTDFAGNPGDNVYAPFDVVFEMTDFYGDPGTYGYYFIGRFADGTLFYSGHLADVIQPEPGALVPAGTVIGHIGELLHTHIKINPPGAPEPCEGSGACIDFEEYYATH